MGEDSGVGVIPRGALVRWLNGQSGNIGVIESADGGRLAVRFDDGSAMQFAWPTKVLERVTFPAGSQVETVEEHEAGVITGATIVSGLVAYQVNLASGTTKSVIETGLRPAIITNPVTLLRSGTLGTARSVNLRIAATRIQFAHQYDNLSSLANSRVDIKEHQVAVLHRVATTYPHRFILADEVGLGKTIEAGLILKELRARGVAKRVLILAPSGIVGQWQYELRRKFNEAFANYTRATITVLEAENPEANVWTLRDSVIASTTFAAWDPLRREQIALAGWDLVIIDEAHHARRTREGEGRFRSTNLYRLAELLADPEQGKALGYLLLTATPMQLDPFELYSLIELLDPTLFADEADFEQHRSELRGLNVAVDRLDRWDLIEADEQEEARADGAWFLGIEEADVRFGSAEGRMELRQELSRKHRLSEVLIRNRKARVGGFMPRHATVWPVEMTELERQAYDAVTLYCRTGYAASRATKNNALGFLMAIFQKLNSSSSYAIRQSLLRRIEKLEARLPAIVDVDEIEEEDLDEGRTEDALGDLLGMSARRATEEEIADLARIVQLLDQIDIDSKAQVLIERLDELAQEEPNVKVLIFTQSRDTQDYLERLLTRDEWRVHIFHGQLDAQEKDRAVAAFRDGRGQEILISTEAGGEGRNFQFCHNVVNYDLPWNPMKVEQRIGRLDRIGQRSPVRIFNFSVMGTIEERVLDVLANRIRVFEETIGGLDPILGNVENDLKRAFALSEAEGAKALANLDKILDSRIRNAREAERKLADLIMDTKSYRKDEVDELLGQRGPVDHNAVRRFVIGALDELGVVISDHPEIKGAYQVRLRGAFENEFPGFVKDGAVRDLTFDPSVARDHEDLEFFAVGHEIVDALIARTRSKGYGGRASYRRISTDEVPEAAGWFFTFVLEFEAVQSLKEVLPVFIKSDGSPEGEMAQWLLSRSQRIKHEDRGDAPIPAQGDAFETAVQQANTIALEHLLARQQDLEQTNRDRVDQERAKLDRFYEYKRVAAREKVASVRRTLERLEASSDSEVLRIVPVWRKNLEIAERDLTSIDGEQARRLAQLAGRETVSAQSELLTASWVEISPP